MRFFGFLLSAFITLHTPSGLPIFVNAVEIMIIRSSLGCSSVGAEVIVHDRAQCVQETPQQVKEKADKK